MSPTPPSRPEPFTGLCVPLRAGSVHLDPLGPADADALWPVLRDPVLHRYLDQTPPESVETLRTLFARIAVGHSADGLELWGNWVMRLPSGEAIGHCQTTVVAPDTAWLAYVLGRPHQGAGHARSATAALIAHLQGLGVRRFLASVEEANTRSAHLLQALGFTPADAASAHAQGLGDTEQLWQRQTDTPSA